jgi:hypothetical protein
MLNKSDSNKLKGQASNKIIWLLSQFYENLCANSSLHPELRGGMLG